jgi:carboxypeptidase Taq
MQLPKSMAENTRIINPVIKELVGRYRTLWAIGHVMALAEWDINTYMPEEGIMARSEAMAKLSVLFQNLFLDESFVSLIKKAEQEQGLTDSEKAIIRVLNRSLKYYQKLPSEFIEEFTKVTGESQIAWKNAKEQNDFSLFAPFLEKIVELEKRKAELLGYEKHPYDALLDEFEEGLTTEEVESFFAQIKEPLKSLISYIKQSPRYREEHELKNKKYEDEKLKDFTNVVLNKIHYDMKHLRVDFSPHPFSIYLGKGDTRITRKNSDSLFELYTSIMHEYGHALYDIQVHDDLAYTPINTGTSLVIHESQSRFWENLIARSKEFVSFLYEEFQKVNPELGDYSVEGIYHYINLVKPSLIRTDADEVTYHMHVLIRFEIEKALIEGKIKVSELPRAWNDKYEEYLGIRPGNDKEGILQDIHWSQGSIGYFPTYSMGTALSAIWKKQLEQNIGEIRELVKTPEGIRKIQDWLKENIHQYGSTHLYKNLVQKATGEKFSAKPLLEYLEAKYKEIY